MQLNPVSFTWKDHPEQGTKLGFIAQQVQTIIPEVVTIGDDAMQTLGLNYTELIPAIVHSIQQIASISGVFETNLIAWLGSSNNGLAKINTDELCVQGTCVTGAQLQVLLASANQSPSAGSSASTNTTPPVIQINGANPATIQIGAAYNDLGATITGPQPDLNLGIKTFLNGSPVSQIQLDTSAAATDTIQYVVTDPSGLTSTSTRQVIIQAANDNQPATTSAATSTSQ